MSTINPDRVGSSFEDFLKEDGIFEECEAAAIKRVIAWELAQYMKNQHVTKTAVAKLMGTSRSLVDRVLDSADSSITLATILKVARVVGKPMQIQFGNGEANCHA